MILLDKNNTYLIPANSKKGVLIFNAFTTTDLIILGVGVFITMVWVVTFPPTELLPTILALLPALITGLLVTPVPNYHNVLVVLIEAANYYTQRQNYLWKGWLFYDESQ